MAASARPGDLRPMPRGRIGSWRGITRNPFPLRRPDLGGDRMGRGGFRMPPRQLPRGSGAVRLCDLDPAGGLLTVECKPCNRHGRFVHIAKGRD